MRRNNSIGSAIRILACVDMACWLFLGFVLGTDRFGDFSFLLALIYWLIGLVSGIMLLGFAEIIFLLDSILYRDDDKNTNKTVSAVQTGNTASPSILKPESSHISKSTEVSDHKTCPKCGLENKSNAFYCDNCGTKL